MRAAATAARTETYRYLHDRQEQTLNDKKNAKSRLARVEIPWLQAESDMGGFEAPRKHSGFGRRDGGAWSMKKRPR